MNAQNRLLRFCATLIIFLVTGFFSTSMDDLPGCPATTGGVTLPSRNYDLSLDAPFTTLTDDLLDYLNNSGDLTAIASLPGNIPTDEQRIRIVPADITGNGTDEWLFELQVFPADDPTIKGTVIVISCENGHYQTQTIMPISWFGRFNNRC